ncbi:MAG: hypothetical protein M1837_006642 [Sclerophora amabilis]|nr:MAG: hypothetical protein M1837_006642 [Sclerophora amabilis]
MPPRRSSRPATTTLSSTPQSGGSQGRKRKSSLPATSKTASPNTIRHSKRIRNVQGDSKLESETPTITKTDTVTQSKKKTRRTSRYFSEDDTSSPRSTGSEDPGNEESESGYEEGQAEAPTTESSVTEDEDDVYSEGEEVRTPKNKKAGRPPKSLEVVGKIKDLWRSGVSTGLGPGKQVIVRLPKARAAGKTPYTDETIHPNTLLFLKDLAQNNEREWLKMHDADFRSSEKDFDSFVAALTEKIIEKDETIPELPVKDIVRIYITFANH